MERINRYKDINGIPERCNLIDELNLYCIVQPLERPRIGKGGQFYTPRDNQLNLYREVNYYARTKSKLIDFPVIVDCFFFFKFKTSEKKFPTDNAYGDTDNLVKAIYDALSPSSKVLKNSTIERKIISDDRLIIGGENFKLFDIPDEEGNSENYAVIKIYGVKL